MAQIIYLPTSFRHTTFEAAPQDAHQTVLGQALKDYNFMLEGLMAGMTATRHRIMRTGKYTARKFRTVPPTSRPISFSFTPSF